MSEQQIKCKANWVVRAGGKRYKPGEFCHLTQDQINVLGKAVTIITAEEPPQVSTISNTEQQAEQLNTLVELITELDKEDESLWAKGGEPKVAPLELLVDFDVTAEMRDAAWAIVLEQAE